MGLVEVDGGIRLNVTDLGQGPPVVLVAGFGLDGTVWDRQVRILAERHRVLCVDQRGHGASDKPLNGYSVAQLAQDLVAALRRCGVENCILVGWSFGGQVAFRAAAAEPDLVSGLVLVGSNAVRASRGEGFPFGREPEPVLAALIEAEHADRLAARRATVASGFAEEPTAQLLDWLVDRSLQMPSWAAIACYESMLTTDLLADLHAVKQPVLQVIGQQDPVHSAKAARWLNTQLVQAELVELDGCGHYPMFEAADAFDSALMEFVDRVDGQTAGQP